MFSLLRGSEGRECVDLESEGRECGLQGESEGVEQGGGRGEGGEQGGG